jgi:hypothetical protein
MPSGVYLSDRSLKAGVSKLTLVRELELPTITTRGRVLFAIACARHVLPVGQIPRWDTWADAFKKRTATEGAASEAARAATWAAWVSEAAAAAVGAAAWAARAAGVSESRRAMEWAARSVEWAAAAAAVPISLIAICNAINLEEE